MRARFLVVVLAVMMAGSGVRAEAGAVTELASTTVPAAAAAPKLIPAADTTLITEPLLPDGTPDYRTALNTEFSKGVTAENNAAVPILRALGPDNIFAGRLPALLETLKVELPADDARFIQFYPFAKDHGGINAGVDNAETAALKAPWVAKDFPLIADWLKANEAPLAQITIASRLAHLYCPLISAKEPPLPSDSCVSPFAATLRSVSQALVERAMLHAGNSEPGAAREDILTIHRLARLEAQAPFIINALIAVTTDAQAFRADEALLRSTALTPAEAKGLLAGLRALPEIQPARTIGDRDEPYYMLWLLLPAVRGQPDEAIHPFIWSSTFDKPLLDKPLVHTLGQVDWNIAFRAVIRRMMSTESACQRPSVSQRHEALQALVREERTAGLPISPDDLFGEPTTQESPEVQAANSKRYLVEVGQFLSRRAGESVPAFSERVALFFTAINGSCEKCPILFDRAITQHRLTLLAAALAVYRADHKAYPDTLEPLHDPAYLSALPPDPFSGKAFVYRTTPAGGYVLYSVGDNGVDDGAKDRSQKGDDIVIRMP